MDILLTIGIIGFIIYLRFYADLRTRWEKDLEQLREGIQLYTTGKYPEALAYFSKAIDEQPQRGIAYLYRARCYRALGDEAAALEDVTTGRQYDDTIPELHLETGQIRYDRRDYQTAFQDFDKAIFHSQGQLAEPFRWRGLARQQLGQEAEAQQDFQKAAMLAQQTQRQPSSEPYVRTAFFDRHLLLSAALTFLSSLLLLLIIKRTTVVHWPYLYAATSAAGIGFAEPRKGWLLALLQVVILWVGYTFFTEIPPTSGLREVQSFSLYGSIGLTLVGSFMGGVLKRQLAK